MALWILHECTLIQNLSNILTNNHSECTYPCNLIQFDILHHKIYSYEFSQYFEYSPNYCTVFFNVYKSSVVISFDWWFCMKYFAYDKVMKIIKLWYDKVTEKWVKKWVILLLNPPQKERSMSQGIIAVRSLKLLFAVTYATRNLYLICISIQLWQVVFMVCITDTNALSNFQDTLSNISHI